MSTALLVPLSEYLHQTKDPDCEYLEGRLMERNVGEISHADAQGRTYAHVLTTQRGFWAGVEVRVQVKTERLRVPDVVVVRGGRPAGRVITAPPEVAVEILSPDDRATDLQEKVDDYLAFGVPTVWVIDPERHRAWRHSLDGSSEVRDGVLRHQAGDLTVPLVPFFPSSTS